ncbi:hypothetical protein BC826DRAFT_651196 [Russula brevipes]|nr:hypothetical protein BC826DRAFT_651196 [Russula brevipes]
MCPHSALQRRAHLSSHLVLLSITPCIFSYDLSSCRHPFLLQFTSTSFPWRTTVYSCPQCVHTRLGRPCGMFMLMMKTTLRDASAHPRFPNLTIVSLAQLVILTFVWSRRSLSTSIHPSRVVQKPTRATIQELHYYRNPHPWPLETLNGHDLAHPSALPWPALGPRNAKHF